MTSAVVSAIRQNSRTAAQKPSARSKHTPPSAGCDDDVIDRTPLLDRSLTLRQLPAAPRFTSSRNSASTLAPSTPLAVASLTHLSMIGLERSCTSLTNSGDGVVTWMPTSFI